MWLHTRRQIPWKYDEQKLKAWTEAKTGFPFIDAIMTQLREEGWVLLAFASTIFAACGSGPVGMTLSLPYVVYIPVVD